MQSSEIVRLLVAGLLCAAGLVLLGFGPLLLPGTGAWAASTDSSRAMPAGESRPAETLRPFEFKQPTAGGMEFVKKHFGR